MLVLVGITLLATLKFAACNRVNRKNNETPYTPYYVIKDYRYTTYGQGDNQGFGTVEVLVDNKTGYDIDYMKFRLKINNRVQVNDINTISSNPIILDNIQTVFNQTIEIRQKIFKGDMVYIEIPALKGFHVGKFYAFSLRFETELIEVLPKPKN